MRARFLFVASAFGAAALLAACTPPAPGGGSTTTTSTSTTSTSTTTSTTTTTLAPQPPVAVIGASTTSGVAHLAVDFTGSGSSDADGPIGSYAWDFGDGGTSTDVNPHHLFVSAGTFDVSLTVTDGSGDTDTDTVTVTATNDPAGRYVAKTGADSGACTDSLAPCLSVQFAVNAAAAAGDTVYVAPGTYAEVVYVAKDVSFKGGNQGVAAETVRAPETVVKGIRTGTASVTPGSVQRNVSIDGFMVDPQGDSTLISASYKPLVWLLGGATATTTIANNVFVGSSSYDPNCKETCTTMTDVALEVRSGAVVASDNAFTKFRRAFWLYQTGPTGTPLTSASVTGNTFTQFTSIGLRIAPSGGNNVMVGMTIDGNTFDNSNGGIGTSSPGGVVATAGAHSYTNNRFDTMGSALYLYSCSAYGVGAQTIAGNSFANVGAAVNAYAEVPACATGKLDGTVISQNDFGAGVVNGVGGSYFTAGQATLDATCNWWNTATGPNSGGANAPAGGVTTSPWLVDTTGNGGACTGS